MMFVYCGLLAVAVLYLLFRFWYNGRVRKFNKLGINYITPTTGIGNLKDAIFMKRHALHCINDIYNAFPDDRFVVFFELAKPIILIRDLELIKSITVSKFDHFSDHTLEVDENIDALFSKSLFTLKGNTWKEWRSALSPAFTPSRLKKMSMLLIKAAEQMKQHFVDKMTDLQLRDNDRDNTLEIENNSIFMTFFHDFTAMAGFGLGINTFEDKEKLFYKMSLKMADFSFKTFIKFMALAAAPKCMKLFKQEFIENETANFFRKIVIDTLREREEQNIQIPDFLGFFLQLKKGMMEDNDTSDTTNSFVMTWKKNHQHLSKTNWSDDDLTATATSFMIAGLDTGSSATGFLFYEMAMNQDIQKKLQAEIDQTLAEHGEFSYDVVQGMEYLSMAVSEIMRKYASIVDRICTKDFDLGPPRPGAQSYTIKKGDAVVIPTFAIQRDPKHWPNPMEFDPERFSKENQHRMSSYAYIPFGSGPRTCIGFKFAELGIKLATIFMLSTFDVLPTDKTPEVIVLDPSSLVLKAQSWNFALKMR